VPVYEAVNWIGIVAPAGTPAAIVAKLQQEIAAIQNPPELQNVSRPMASEAMRMGPAVFRRLHGAGMGKWERVVKEGGIKAA